MEGYIQNYLPISNRRIEDLLSSLYEDPEEGDTKLEALVNSRLTPRKKSEPSSLFLTDEQKMIKIALKCCLEFHGYDRRDVGNNYYSKHPVDVAGILVKYNLGENVDYLDVIGALLHDLEEEKGIRPIEILTYFTSKINDSDIKEKDRHLEAVGEIIDLVSDLTKREPDYTKFLERVFENERTARIKLADRIAQSFEMDPMQYYGVGTKVLDGIKHYLASWLGKERIRRLKEKGAEASEMASERKYAILRPDILVYSFLYRAYKRIEHLRLPGDRILNAAYKDFRNIDFACRYINTHDYDPTIVALKNMLIFSTLRRVINPRMQHLVDGRHVSQKEIEYAEDKVRGIRESGELYVLTGFERPLKETDIILPFYSPAMTGNKEMLRSLDDFKEIQYLHLAIWKELFRTYERDAVTEPNGNLKNRGLFTFDFGAHDGTLLLTSDKTIETFK